MHNVQKVSRRERLSTLKMVVEKGMCDSQQALLGKLKRMGFVLTQATLSRDLAQLGIVKEDGKYAVRPMSPAFGGAIEVISMKHVEPNMIVIRTSPGSAQPIAFAIDKASIDGVAGTVAGDDTIFVAVEHQASPSIVLKTMNKVLSRARSRS